MAKKKTPLQRRLEGLAARKGRKNIKLEVEVEEARKPEITRKKVVSGSKLKFGEGANLKDLAKRFGNIINSRIRKDKLNQRVQGYSVDPIVIKKEITKPNSPFNWEGKDGKKLYTSQEIDRTAREISTLLWKELKRSAIARSGKLYNFTGMKSIPNDFAFSNEIKVGFDNNIRTIYYSSKGDSYRSFTEVFLRNTFERIRKTYPETSNLRAFIDPNEEWLEFREASKQRAISDPNRKTTAKTAGERAIANARGEYRKKTGRLDYEGLHAGHTFGDAATRAAFFLADQHDIAHKYDPENIELTVGLPEEIRPQIVKDVKFTIETDTELEFERRFSKSVTGGSGFFARVTILVPEDAITNAREGAKINQARQRLVKDAKTLLDALLNIKGSPSYKELLADLVIGNFTGRKTKSGTVRASAKFKKSTQLGVQVRGATGARGEVRYNSPKTDKDNLKQPNLHELIDFLNRKLHDKIQENMGKGGSKKILNYRTGRFARSAKIEQLYSINEKNAIGAGVKYMRDPYGVFEKGGRLHLSGRDPQRIFGRSIRQLLQEERIANLRRVKVDLRG